jgi:hypothetical protein
MAATARSISSCGAPERDNRAVSSQIFFALFVTYRTAFVPHWQRKRKLRDAGKRLLKGTCLFLDNLADVLSGSAMSEGDRDFMRKWIKDRLETINALVVGMPLKRPDHSKLS